ncbi:GM24763 [Drosophila sechellia]|uniref:GM24763 n=1 Tax=Drosophila sechellia TaxID=7238 RepID=B4HEC2_DROSE|nr:GM24763 [Drosophila sechellia]
MRTRRVRSGKQVNELPERTSGQQFAFGGERMRCLGILIVANISLALATSIPIPIANHSPLGSYEMHLKILLQKILWVANVKRCFAVITDDLHYPIYDRIFFESVGRRVIPFFVMRTNESEDLQRPSKQVELFVKAIKSSDCELNVITILNGWQVQRFLGYIYDNRSLNMQKKFVLLYDSRLFDSDMIHLWSVFIGAIFLKRQLDNKYTISTIAFPGILSGVLVMKNIVNWELGKGVNGRILFADKTSNLFGTSLPVAISEHVPMVLWANASKSFQGVEVEIMNALGKALNFKPVYYKPNQTENMDWELDGTAYGGGNPDLYGQNGTHIDSMLVDEVAAHSARFAIGDLHLFQVYLKLVELSAPHNFECLTFLTPESSTDNSWQTFILPFSAGMWAGVLLSLFVVGTVFYAISFLNAIINGNVSSEFFRCLRPNRSVPMDPKIYRRISFRIAISRYRPSKGDRMPRDLFDGYANCILLTYSMLLYVALPRMPRNWPLRVLTGWYWIYCILLVATYRASFTAILANPAARVTIDTLEDLLRSHIPPTAGANENRQFFLDANDEVARKVGEKMQVVGYSDDLTSRIAKAQCAYYDNEFYLRYLRVADESGSALHIMKECVLHMPVVLAMEKNSALKPRVDASIQHLAEGGLIAKWLKDAIEHLPAEALAPQEALMNIQKFWSSFVALLIGYVISLLTLFAERWHFKHIVMKHPIIELKIAA